jgi:hypothetical protein
MIIALFPAMAMPRRKAAVELARHIGYFDHPL